jgi:type IV pili sensor histidine kinase/response regulator
MGLNALDLDAISQDARDCFLYEDAPEQVALLEAEAHNLHRGETDRLQANYTDLIRAAHSLKGGAGLAQLPVISQLAHRLEDLLEALQEQRVLDLSTAHELVTLSIDQVTQLITNVTNGRPEPNLTDLPLLQALDEFLESVPEADFEAEALTAHEASGGSSAYLTQVALEVDLEDCLQRMDQVLQQTHDPEVITTALMELVEACMLLGQTLDVDWLIAPAQHVYSQLAQPHCVVMEVVIATLTDLRTQRRQTLAALSGDRLATEHSEFLAPNFTQETTSDLPHVNDAFAGLDANWDLDSNQSSLLSATDLPSLEDTFAGLDAIAIDSSEVSQSTTDPLHLDNHVVDLGSILTLEANSALQTTDLPSLDAVFESLEENSPVDSVDATEITTELSVLEATFAGLEDNPTEEAGSTLGLLTELAGIDATIAYETETPLAADVAPALEPEIPSLIFDTQTHSTPPPTHQLLPTSTATLERTDPQDIESMRAMASSQPEALASAPSPERYLRSLPTINLRIPFTKVDRMSNTVGELLINHERLSLFQQQLQQVSHELKKRTEQFNPIQDQVQTFYDRLATSWVSGVSSPLTATNASYPNEEFDALQFDRYTDLHTTLQTFQELMVRIQETRSDMDLVNQDLQEALDQLRQQLNHLSADFNQSRLVPFRNLAQKFIPSLQSLNRQHQKSVDLEIIGEKTLIDQLLVEQLKTPLTHLFRNAFDHGIETACERQALGKPATAKIQLSAKVQGSMVVITVTDDGRGIDTVKVGQKALQAGLCRAEDLPNLSRDQMFEFLFASGFSTKNKVSSLSGRGVGLDVVRLQVERLRGSVRVQTTLGEGTQFILTLPLTISILPLLLCQCHERTIAVPSISVLEIIALHEFYDPHADESEILWQNQRIPLVSLRTLLPYQQPGMAAPEPKMDKLALVVDMDGQPLAVAVDALLGERELVLKPFDHTIPVPSYVVGCTVLGTGEVVPVYSPTHFEPLLRAYQEQGVGTAHPSDEPMSETADPTILIVDDSIAVRRLLNRLLTQSGFQVIQCRDGKEALDELNRLQQSLDLVISDVEMPRVDGYSLLKEIRAHARWHSLPVAMLTSRGGDRHRQKAQMLGATSYLTKPFQPLELLNEVNAMIN